MGFLLKRAKTGEPALGTLSRRTRKLVEAYVAGLGYELHDEAPIFRSRGYAPGLKGGRPHVGVPYTKDSLGADFADVRLIVFGTDEKRKLMDMRRSGAVESMAEARRPKLCPPNLRTRWTPINRCGGFIYL